MDLAAQRGWALFTLLPSNGGDGAALLSAIKKPWCAEVPRFKFPRNDKKMPKIPKPLCFRGKCTYLFCRLFVRDNESKHSYKLKGHSTVYTTSVWWTEGQSRVYTTSIWGTEGHSTVYTTSVWETEGAVNRMTTIILFTVERFGAPAVIAGVKSRWVLNASQPPSLLMLVLDRSLNVDWLSQRHLK